MAATSLWAQTPDAIVLDNEDAIISGEWTKGATARDKWKESYHFSSTVADASPKATATYRPVIPKAGNYHVDLFYPQGDKRAPNAPWLISSEDGEKIVEVNQQVTGGQWVRIASNLKFAAGQKNFIQLMNNTGTTGWVVMADGVRLVPAEANIPAIAPIPTPAIPAPGSTRPAANRVKLDVRVQTGGKVVKSPDGTEFAPGATVTLTPQANEGYVFDGWEGSAQGYKVPLKLVMNEAKSVTARFAVAGVGVILDNADPEVEFKGSWDLSPTAFAGTRYENYRTTSARPKADAWATFRPKLPKSGKYDVYAWYVKGENRSTGVPYTVFSKS